jgi:hypothetical protein
MSGKKPGAGAVVEPDWEKEGDGDLKRKPPRRARIRRVKNKKKLDAPASIESHANDRSNCKSAD